MSQGKRAAEGVGPYGRKANEAFTCHHEDKRPCEKGTGACLCLKSDSDFTFFHFGGEIGGGSRYNGHREAGKGKICGKREKAAAYGRMRRHATACVRKRSPAVAEKEERSVSLAGVGSQDKDKDKDKDKNKDKDKDKGKDKDKSKDNVTAGACGRR